VLHPVIVRDGQEVRSYGARALTLAASSDGRTFTSPQRMELPSGVGSPDETASAPIAPVEARFLLLRWLDGWQRKTQNPPVMDIRIRAIEVRSAEGAVLPARIAQVGALLSPPVQFSLSVLLREGRNLLTVRAGMLGPDGEGIPSETDFATVAATFLPELPAAPKPDAPPLVLSDGSRLVVAVLPGAADETMRGLSILPDSPDDVPPATYGNNRRIREGSRPILAYRFEGRFQTAFRAEATAALPGQPATLAVDGRLDFPSTWVSNLAPMPIQWKVDLEAPIQLGRVVVRARKEGSTSFAPQRARILVSTDGDAFTPVADAAQFQDDVTSIPLPTTPTARWVILLIEESKQANNVQINEIEFFDASGTRVLAQRKTDHLLFRRPVRIALRYFPEDLIANGVRDGAPLGLFLWHPQAREWQATNAQHALIPDPSSGVSKGGGVGGLFTLELNVLAPLALFELVPSPASPEELTAQWSFNPFSPNGDGVADTTRLAIHLAPGPYAESIASPKASQAPEVTVRIFDVRGMLVQTLADRTSIPSGSLLIEWDGLDRNGRQVPIGPYIYEVIVHRDDAASRVRRVHNGVIVVVR
jgi:hypothetical protein